MREEVGREKKEDAEMSGDSHECEVPEENQYEGIERTVGDSVCSIWTGLACTFRKHYPLNQYLFNSSVCY